MNSSDDFLDTDGTSGMSGICNAIRSGSGDISPPNDLGHRSH